MSETSQAKETRGVQVYEPDAEKGPEADAVNLQEQDAAKQADAVSKPRETGGPTGPEPTRYGDWERKGRCIDF